MFKVKIKRLFKLSKAAEPFTKGDVVELSDAQIKAINKQLGTQFIEVIEEIKPDEPESIDFDALKVPDIKDWLTEHEVEFADESKAELVKLAAAKQKELKEVKE